MDVPVPIFLWHHAPAHAATVAAASRAGDVVATGDAAGGVYLWSARAQWVGAPVRAARARAPSAGGPSAADGYAPDEVVPLPPFALLARHSAPIAALVFARDGGDELLLSVDAAGAAALWDARDGSVIRQYSALLPELAPAAEGTRGVACCGGAVVVIGDGTGGGVHGMHVLDVGAVRTSGARAGASSRAALASQRRAGLGSAGWAHSVARRARAAAERCVGVASRSDRGGGAGAPGGRSGAAWWFGAAGAVRRYAWETSGAGEGAAAPKCELVAERTLSLPGGGRVVAVAGLRGGSRVLIVTPTAYCVMDAAGADDDVLLQALVPLPAPLRGALAVGAAACATRDAACAVVWAASGAAACVALDAPGDAAGAGAAPRAAVSLALNDPAGGACGAVGAWVCARANMAAAGCPVFVATTGTCTRVWTVAPPEGDGAGPLPRVALVASGLLAMGAGLDATDASRAAPARLGACTAALVVQPETLGELDFGGAEGSSCTEEGGHAVERAESVELRALAFTPGSPMSPPPAEESPRGQQLAVGAAAGGSARDLAGAALPVQPEARRAASGGTLDPASDDEDLRAQIAAAGARGATSGSARATAAEGVEGAKLEAGGPVGTPALSRQESDANSELTDNLEDDVESEDVAVCVG